MYDTLQLLCVGTAAVIDAVLLLALMERRNWPFVRAPIVLVIVGVGLWHGSLFLRMLMTAPTGSWPDWLQWCSLMVLAGGLFVMPSAMLHGMLRLWRSGLEPHPRAELRYGVAYLPMLALVPIGYWVAADPQGDLLEVVAPLVVPYILWLGLANVLSAVGFLDYRSRVEQPWARRFFSAMAATLLAMTGLHLFVFLIARPLWPDYEALWILAVAMSPVVPSLLFAYFVIRYHFMKLVLERTLVYGAIVVCALFYHRVAWQNVSNTIQTAPTVDLVILESLVIIGLILAYQPLRQRTSEALRYFFGSRVAQLRERTRRLAVELAHLSGQPPAEVLAWFAEQAVPVLDMGYVAGWLFTEAGQVTARCGATDRLADERAAALHRELTAAGVQVCTWREAPNRAALDDLQSADASLAVVMLHPRGRGLMLFGRRRGHDFGEEEANAAALLVEQLGITLNTGLLQAERLAAERRALQSEKLSALGLLASSIAHEVKNPLSSIKTIATVLGEQLTEELGPNSRHAEDLRLILGEVDRLSAATTQLLEFARPALGDNRSGRVDQVLAGTLRVMRHLARNRGVVLESQVADNLPPARADAAALQEILVNLLANSIDAAGPGGCVSVTCLPVNGHVVTEVRDTGPGIPPEVQDRLFEPFFTTKPAGTGLGLYVVGRRVRELGGEIRCDSSPGQGTRFTVTLPINPGAG